jgi:hypothetical protein
MLSWGETIAKIKVIGAACYANLLCRILFNADLPGAAPPQRAKPNVAAVLII